MTEAVFCLDTSILIKFLVPEAPEELRLAARELVRRTLTNGRLVAPAWAWAEVGSVLRKKVRTGVLRPDQADQTFAKFLQLPIHFVDTPILRLRAWELAQEYGLPTLYDATFLACTEVIPAVATAVREFWTADHELLRQLGSNFPGYVHLLSPA